MGRFLNSIVPFEGYKDIVRTRFFVDKSPVIEEIISALAIDGQKYLCITRPRRFGKTVMAIWLALFSENPQMENFCLTDLKLLVLYIIKSI